MGLLKGTLTVSRFLALGPAPDRETLVSGLSNDRFRPFEDGVEEERSGWCDWRNGLFVPPDPDWMDLERFTLMGLRVDTRKVPKALLDSHVELRIQRILAEKDLRALGKEARLSIVDEVKAELIRKVMPTMKMYEAAWDIRAGEVLFAGASSKAQTLLAKLFMKSFGVELQPILPLSMAAKVTPEISTDTLLGLDPLDFEVEV